MYDINMKNFHYKGFLDITPNAVDFFTKKMIIAFVLE
jgi:hypothetical protein